MEIFFGESEKGKTKNKVFSFSDYVAKNFWDGFRQLNAEIFLERKNNFCHFAEVPKEKRQQHCCLCCFRTLNVSGTGKPFHRE
jgi:hypothetical protein